MRELEVFEQEHVSGGQGKVTMEAGASTKDGAFVKIGFEMTFPRGSEKREAPDNDDEPAFRAIATRD